MACHIVHQLETAPSDTQRASDMKTYRPHNYLLVISSAPRLSYSCQLLPEIDVVPKDDLSTCQRPLISSATQIDPYPTPRSTNDYERRSTPTPGTRMYYVGVCTFSLDLFRTSFLNLRYEFFTYPYRISIDLWLVTTVKQSKKKENKKIYILRDREMFAPNFFFLRERWELFSIFVRCTILRTREGRTCWNLLAIKI